MDSKERDFAEIRLELARKRDEWNRVRLERLGLKQKLIEDGLNKQEIRKNPVYKQLEKDQAHLSTVLKHIERRLNRKMVRLVKNEKNS